MDPPRAIADPPEAIADPPSPVPYSDDDDSAQRRSQEDSQEEEDDDQTEQQEDNDDDEETSHDQTEEEEDLDESQQQAEDANDEGEQGPRRTRASRGGDHHDYHHLRIRATTTLPLVTDPAIACTVREIGKSASWSLSSAKPGNGVDQLRDSSLDTYWQSDGLQPHYVNIQFPKRQTISAISLYMDFNLDESYTPKRIKVRVGTTFHNLEEVRVVDVREPVGWCTIPLWRKWGEDVLDSIMDPEGDNDDDEDDDEEELPGATRRKRRKKKHVPLWKRKPMRTHFVQIGVTSMHQNGRDTHIRQVKIFGPRDELGGRGGVGAGGAAGRGESRNGAAMMTGGGKLSIPAFQTVGMSQFSTIR